METRWPGLTVRKSPTEIFVSIFIYQLDFDPSFVSTVVSNLSPICHQFVTNLSPICLHFVSTLHSTLSQQNVVFHARRQNWGRQFL